MSPVAPNTQIPQDEEKRRLSAKMLRRRAKDSATADNQIRAIAAKDFRVVCLGGSAGGLEAYMGILRNLPADTGMAFVVAQHQR